MRLFVALDIDDATRATVGALIDRLRRTLRTADVKWVAAPNLHVTLQFIGAVDAERAARIRDTLTAPVEVPPFVMRIKEVGMFPSRGNPRVIWCGADDPGASLGRVQREIERRLVSIGAVEPQSRPFHAHVSLGRYRGSGSGDDRRRLDALVVGELGRVAVGRATVYESRLSPGGPTYVALAHTSFETRSR